MKRLLIVIAVFAVPQLAVAVEGKPVAKLKTLRLGAAPTTAAGRRALLLTAQRLEQEPMQLLPHLTTLLSPAYRAARALAEVEVVAETMNRPVSWVRDNWAALRSFQKVDRDGKPLTAIPKIEPLEDEPAAAAPTLDLTDWEPGAGHAH